MTHDASDFGAHWLATARRSSWAVWDEWLHGTYALLPTGALWDVIAMPQYRLTSAAEHQREAWAEVPILADLGAGYAYVWVPSGTHTTWAVPGTTALGRPWWIAVPRPGGPQVPERRWVQPPGLSPRLMDPQALSAALSATPATGTGREAV
ncbi:hypothetical protein ACFYUJ_38810 [Streptomyces sp. NPDC004520]|uniref:hypothetical protein n=1 Tax=Streptomyces sp. NPDC004520 TaxID=3364702 RepID=UPI003695B3B4